MTISGMLRSMVPGVVKRGIRTAMTDEIRWILAEKEVLRLGPNHILSSLYSPARLERAPSGKWVWSRPATGPAGADGLPMPPSEFRMGHAENDDSFLEAGKNSADQIRRVMAREGIDLSKGAAVLDWGCASGRVLRHFAAEARDGDFWGVDEHGPCMAWDKVNLSPPFRFVTCTAYPHLPFEDNTFILVYGLSVFTHIRYLSDVWLMEFRRILKRGGYALFTIHDESTVDCLTNHESWGRLWKQNGWWVAEDFRDILRHDMEMAGSGEKWGRVTSFFKRDWIRSEWGQYFDVISFEPRSQSYQTTVVLRKR